jgi:hypothetical protein
MPSALPVSANSADDGDESCELFSAGGNVAVGPADSLGGMQRRRGHSPDDPTGEDALPPPPPAAVAPPGARKGILKHSNVPLQLSSLDVTAGGGSGGHGSGGVAAVAELSIENVGMIPPPPFTGKCRFPP